MLMIPKADILHLQPFREYKTRAGNNLKLFQSKDSSKTYQSRKDNLKLKN